MGRDKTKCIRNILLTKSFEDIRINNKTNLDRHTVCLLKYQLLDKNGNDIKEPQRKIEYQYGYIDTQPKCVIKAKSWCEKCNIIFTPKYSAAKHFKEYPECETWYMSKTNKKFRCQNGCELQFLEQFDLLKHYIYHCNHYRAEFNEKINEIHCIDRRKTSLFGAPPCTLFYANGRIKYCNLTKKWKCTTCDFEANHLNAKRVFMHVRSKHGTPKYGIEKTKLRINKLLQYEDDKIAKMWLEKKGAVS